MGRILFTYIVPFLVPMAVYTAWVLYRSAYAERHGGDAPRLEQGPWPLLLFLGAAFALVALGATALLSGGSADKHYVPPRVENGAIIPGHLEPRKP